MIEKRNLFSLQKSAFKPGFAFFSYFILLEPYLAVTRSEFSDMKIVKSKTVDDPFRKYIYDPSSV